MGFIKDIGQKVIDRYYLYKYIFPFIKRNKDREISIDNSLCLFSFPRSGSTWLVEILLQIPNSCLIDEPLQRNKILTPNDIPDYNSRKLKEIADFGFWFYQPLPEEMDDEHLKNLFRKILSGRALSIGLYNDYGLGMLKNAQYYITKFNYGQLLSAWFHAHFDIRSIYLVRSPFACIASMKVHPFYDKLTIPQHIVLPDFRYNDLFKNHLTQYKKIKSLEEYYAFIWCINNKEGYFKNQGKGIFHLFYEDLLLNYDNTLFEMYSFLDMDVPLKSYQLEKKPSLSTMKLRGNNIDTKAQLHSWKEVLTRQNMKEIKDMLEYFEIAEYRQESIPNHLA